MHVVSRWFHPGRLYLVSSKYYIIFGSFCTWKICDGCCYLKGFDFNHFSETLMGFFVAWTIKVMTAKGKVWADQMYISSFLRICSSFQFFDSSWQKKVTVAYWLCFCNGKPLVYRVLYEAPLRTQSPLTNSLPISKLMSKIT